MGGSTALWVPTAGHSTGAVPFVPHTVFATPRATGDSLRGTVPAAPSGSPPALRFPLDLARSPRAPHGHLRAVYGHTRGDQAAVTPGRAASLRSTQHWQGTPSGIFSLSASLAVPRVFRGGSRAACCRMRTRSAFHTEDYPPFAGCLSCLSSSPHGEYRRTTYSLSPRNTYISPLHFPLSSTAQTPPPIGPINSYPCMTYQALLELSWPSPPFLF